jgi:hypothetical protein
MSDPFADSFGDVELEDDTFESGVTAPEEDDATVSGGEEPAEEPTEEADSAKEEGDMVMDKDKDMDWDMKDMSEEEMM